jgi:hypothetical protein
MLFHWQLRAIPSWLPRLAEPAAKQGKKISSNSQMAPIRSCRSTFSILCLLLAEIVALANQRAERERRIGFVSWCSPIRAWFQNAECCGRQDYKEISLDHKLVIHAASNVNIFAGVARTL